jgi:predicted small lipoprotein YifL
MKVFNLMAALALMLGFAGCVLYGPVYFGTKYPPTTVIESFYSTKDITKPFEIIGHMNASTGYPENSQTRTRQLVIEKAKGIGGDGVVFSELSRQVNRDTGDDYTIKVDVIKFK